MVRPLLFFLLILLLPLMSKSQVTVSVDPVSFIMTGNPNETDISYHIHVTNTTNQTINIFWSKKMTNNPGTWLSWICDKNVCYVPEVNACPSSKPNVVYAGEGFTLEVHMNPSLIEGSGDYLLNILDESGNILSTIDGQILISHSTAIKETNDTKLTIYPNPATEFFKVSDIAGLKIIELFNIVGNKVRSFEAVPQKQYYIGDLTDGIYLVRLESANGKVIKTIRLSKR